MAAPQRRQPTKAERRSAKAARKSATAPSPPGQRNVTLPGLPSGTTPAQLPFSQPPAARVGVVTPIDADVLTTIRTAGALARLAADAHSEARDDPEKRREAGQLSLFAAMMLFKVHQLPNGPLLEMCTGNEDLHLGRTPSLYRARRYGKGGQAIQVGKAIGHAYLVVAVEAQYWLDGSKSYPEAAGSVLDDLEKSLPSTVRLDEVMRSRETRRPDPRPLRERQREQLESWQKELRRGIDRSGSTLRLPVSAYENGMDMLEALKQAETGREAIRPFIATMISMAGKQLSMSTAPAG